MQDEKFREFLKKRRISEDDIDKNLLFVEEIEKYFLKRSENLDDIDTGMIQSYIDILIEKGENSIERLVSIARYYYSINRHYNYIYFTQLLGGLNVIENINKRIEENFGKECVKKILQGLKELPLGAGPKKKAEFTLEYMKRLEENLSEADRKKVLTGNNHDIPIDNFFVTRDEFKNHNDIDLLLKNMHSRAVKTLEEHYEQNKIWFEQEITPGVIDFVKNNQELLAGVRKGDKIYNTKIPYNPDKYLTEKDPVLKRYYACHCPFARESILNDNINIDKTWCYCSGFNKLKFDVIFEEPVEVEVIESVLSGDDRCRFVFKIPDKYL
jgi:hypothetical protein